MYITILERCIMVNDVENQGLKRGTLELLEYNDNYTKIFNEEKLNLEKILDGFYVKIEHVGSTAIKGIKSKPIIDILITCNNLDEFIEFVKKNVASDIYTIKEEPTKGGDFLIRKEENGKVKAFIHVLPENSSTAKNYILFRDYLNRNIDEAKKYEKLKLKLYNKYKNDRQSYTLGKDKYINGIIKKAQKEEYR